MGELVSKLKPRKIYMNIPTLDKLKGANANSTINRFSNSNLNLRKHSPNIQLQGDWYQNLPSLIANPAFNVKIFEQVLSQLHGDFKQDI